MRDLEEIARSANIPTLLMVIYQVTGDRRWLQPPYRPTRSRGLGDHDTGGLPEDIQSEIRHAAAEAFYGLQQGKPPALGESTLHPFAPNLTGRAAKDLPIDKLKVPAGFKVEVWAEGIPEARSLARGEKGTVFVSNRLSKNVYAVVDSGGRREVKTLLKGLDAPNGIVFCSSRRASREV